MSEQQQALLGDDSYSGDLAEQIDQIPVDIQRKWPKDLAALVAIYEGELQRMGVDTELAQKISLKLLLAQSTYAGGRYFYLPKGDRLKQAIRDYRIWEEFNGRNITELAGHYGLTVQRVYSIVAEQRALALKEAQPMLF